MAEAKTDADQPPVTKTGKVVGWLKAALVSSFGLLSGAAMMYASPLLDKVFKPATPLANFQAEANGLKVTFHNRSTGGTQGWWDFGDGTALEPFVPNQDATHTYPRPGTFSVKLSVKNLINEANDRTIALTLDAERPGPSIDEFTVTPVAATPFPTIPYAPATFRVAAKHKNADLCVWSIGDDQPLEIEEDALPSQERMVTFKQPGTYVVRFAIFNGKQTVERKEKVTVNPPPAGVTTVLVQVTYEAMRIKLREKLLPVAIHFPTNTQGNTFAFSYEFQAEHGFAYTQAKLGQAAPAEAKNVQLEISADKHKVKFTGDLVKPGGLLNRNAPLPQWTVPLVLTQEWRGEMKKRPPQQSAVTLTVPGTTELRLPAVANGWVPKGRTLDLELRKDGNVVLARHSDATPGRGVAGEWAAVLLDGHRVGGSARIEVTPAPGVGPLGN